MSEELSKNSSWFHFMPMLGAHVTYVKASEKRLLGTVYASQQIDALNTCREGVISNFRQGLQAYLCSKKKEGEWRVIFTRKAECLLAHEKARNPGGTYLYINPGGISPSNDRKITAFRSSRTYTPNEEEIQSFVNITNATLGLVCAVLSPERYTGNWWETRPDEWLQKGYVRYYGTDNFFLRHPVLMSMALGLFRQAGALSRAGVGAQIEALAPKNRVEEVLTSGDRRKALQLITQLRPFIEVPIPKNSSRVRHFAFPQGGYWKRLFRLERAVRRHGYDAIFGQDLIDSWQLTQTQPNSLLSGIYSYWGYLGKDREGEQNRVLHDTAHNRLMELGQPKRIRRG